MKRSVTIKCLLAVLVIIASCFSESQAQIQWSNTGASTAWYTAANWNPSTSSSAWTTGNIAQFLNAGSATTAGINIGTSPLSIGAIEVTSARSRNLTIGNSSGTAGNLTLNGATVNSVANVILRNSSSSNLTIQDNESGSGKTMNMVLANAVSNVANVEGSGNIVIGSAISGTSRLLSVNLTSTGDFRVTGNNSYSGGTTINGTSTGKYRVDATNSLPPTGNVTIGTGGHLTLFVAGTYGGTSQAMIFNPNQTSNPSLDITSLIAVTWQGTVAVNADTRIESNGATGSLTFSGNMSGTGSLIKQAAGNLILSGSGNTLSGSTQIGNGTLTVNSGSLMGTGALLFAQTSTNNTAIILNNSAQSISTLSSQFTAVTGTQTQILTLNGTALTINQAANAVFGAGAVSTLSSTITGTGSIIKEGSAALTLSSTNNYSGATTINNGELKFNPPTNSTLNGNVNLGGGKLGTSGIAASVNLTFGKLNLTENSTIDLSSANAHNIFFAASNLQSWTSGKNLIITGWQGSFNGTAGTVGKIFIGSSNTALTSGQLSQITFKDGSNVSYPAGLLSSGELVPVTACIPPAITSAATSNSPVCQNLPLNLSVVASGSSPSYAWSGTGTFSVNNSSAASSTSVTGAASGTYTVTVTNGCGFTTSSVNVTINPLPSQPAAITGNSTICQGATALLSDATTGGVWGSDANSVVSVDASGNITGGNPGTAHISYTVSNGCGSASSTLLITVNPAVTATVNITASPSNIICSGTSVTFTASGTNGGGSPLYKFFVNGLQVTNTTPTTYASSTLADGDLVTATLTSSADCVSPAIATSNTITISVTTSVVPSITISSDAPSGIICSGTNVIFSSTIVNGGSSPSYQWYKNSGQVGTNSPSYSDNALADNDQISCILTSNNGCASPTTATSNVLTFTVNPQPAQPGAISGSSTVCTGATISLSNSVNGGSWNSSATSVASVDASGTVSGLTVGTTIITYQITNSCGTASATKTINVTTVPTVAAISGATSLCQSATTTLSSTTGGGTWSSDAPGTASVDASGIVSGVSAGSAVISYAVTNGCGTTTVTKSITVNPLPATPAAITGPSSVCSGSFITLADAVSGGLWSSDATGIASVNSSGIVNGVSSGNAIISYIISNSCGSNSVTASISVNPTPTVTVNTPSITVTPGTQVTITASGATTYLWSTGAVSASITVTPAATTTYTVTGTTSGCSATAQSVVTVNAGNVVVLQIGNGTETLTPNGNSLFLKQFNSTGSVISTLAIPNSGCTPLITSANATSEGSISQSADKSFIIIPGYVVPYGFNSGLAASNSATVNRGIGRVDASGNFTLPAKSSTAFNGNNIRGAASDGNDNFWASGNGTGISYFGKGSPVTVASSPNNTRSLSTQNGNLYFSSASGSFIGISQVGSGYPTNTGNTNVLLISTGAGSSPYGFQFNTNNNVCYISDDRATSAGGIQKWVFSGTSWTLAYTLGTGVSNIGARGLAVDFTGTNPVIYATTAEIALNRLIKITDTGAASAATTIGTASTNTIYRGVTFAPLNSCTSTITITPTVTNSCGSNTGSVSIAVSGGTAPYSYEWSNTAGTVCQTSQTLSGVGGGTYTVKVTDAFGHCFATSSSVVTQSAPPAPVISGTLGFCPGFSTVLNAGTSDANGSYTSYLWSNSVTTQTNTINTAGTYSVTVTNTNGCTASASVAVVQYTNPSPAISGNLSFCSGGSTTLNAGSGYSSYLWSNSQTTQSINVSAAGTYTVTVTNSQSCSGTASATVTQSSGLTPVISGDLSFCTGSNTILSTATGYVSYQWALNGNDINLANSNSFTASLAGSYTVTVSDGFCSGTSAPAVVTINSLPTVSISPSAPATVCKGISTVLTASGSTATYLWSPSTGLNTTSGSSVTATPNSNTTYTVTATDGNGCKSSSNVTVNIYQLPTVTVDVANAVVCPGSSVTLTASGATLYSWSPPTYLNTTSGAVVTSTSPAANITYTVTGTDANGCTNTAVSNIIVVPASASPTVSSPVTYCQNSTAFPLSATANPSSATLLWYTTASGGTGSTTAPTPNTSSPGSVNYYVSEVQSSDLAIAINGFIDNRNPDLFSFVALSPIPSGTEIYFTDNGWTGSTFRGYPATGLAGSEGVCKFIATNTISAGTVIISYSTSPNYSWISSGTIGAASGAANSFTQLAFSQTGDQIYAFMSNVPSNPIGNISKHLFVFDDTNGFESSVNTSDGGIPPGLSQSDGTAITFQGFIVPIPPSVTGQGTYYSLINDGQYRTMTQWFSYLKSESNYTKLSGDATTPLSTVSLNVASACESARVLIQVNVTVAPDPEAFATTDVCPGSDILLFSDPNFLFTAYSWTGPAGFTSSDQNTTVPAATTANSGDYIIVVTDVSGCTGSQTINVNVSSPVPTAVITNTTCAGGATGAIDVTVSGGVAPYTFSWSNSATTEDLTGLAAGTYTVVVTDVNGCIGDPVSFTISAQNSSSSITASASPSSVCPGTISSLTVTGTAGSTYQWSPAGTLNTSTGSQVTASPLTTTLYTVVSTEPSGCTATTSVTVTVYTAPSVLITPSSITICNGESATLVSSGASTYVWTGSSLNTTAGNTVIASPSSTTSYSVIGTDNNGCTNTASAIVTVTGISNVTSPAAAATGFSGGVRVSWVNPSSCFDEVIVLAATSANTGVPAGNGSAYTSDLNYGNPATALGNGFIVYKGSASPEIVTGLTNGTQYFFKIYTRKGSIWSSGTTDVTATPNVLPTLTEVILPRFIEGNTSSNPNRIPCAYYLTLTGLNPNSTYRYINQVINSGDGATTSGAGNVIFTSAGGSFTSTSSPSLLNAGPYGTLITDATGAYSGWFITEPSGNIRFTPGADINFRIRLNDGANGESAVTYLTTTSGVRVLNLASSSTNGTGLRGNSNGTPKNFVVLYDNVSGNNRPLAASFIESDGSTNTANYAAFYSSVENVNGAYGVVIPNANANGVRRIEQRSLVGANIVGCPATDADGIWTGGANTVNPSGGTTALVITNSDAPLYVSPVTGANTLCAGSTISLSDATAGGTWGTANSAIATVNISGVVTGIAAGTTIITYTLPSGCSAGLSITVNPKPLLSATATQIQCNGGTGSVTLLASGGTSPYTYGGAATTGLTAGNYNYSVTDANTCTASASATINTAPAAIVVSGFTPASGAAGSSVVINGSGFTGATGVSFNGTAATLFNVDNDNQITVTVQAGSTSGTVTVFRQTCTGVSSAVFTVSGGGVVLNLTVFIQGLYIGNNAMTSVLVNTMTGTDPNECDSIRVDLIDASTLLIAESDSAVLMIDGTATLNFSSAIAGNSYYIVVKHRNSIETWSKDPVLFSSITMFDLAH